MRASVLVRCSYAFRHAVEHASVASLYLYLAALYIQTCVIKRTRTHAYICICIYIYRYTYIIYVCMHTRVCVFTHTHAMNTEPVCMEKSRAHIYMHACMHTCEGGVQAVQVHTSTYSVNVSCTGFVVLVRPSKPTPDIQRQRLPSVATN